MKTPPSPRPCHGRQAVPSAVTLLAGLLAALVLAAPPAARAQVAARVQNLAVFGNNYHDGGNPTGPLVQGSDGNFYGTTTFGGTYSRGTVFRATPAGEITTLYSFNGDSDGAGPVNGVVIGRDGNFYGTTSGGSLLPGGPSPSGTIYQLTPAGVLTTLHRFTQTSSAGLIQGADGNFYGVAPVGYAGCTGPICPGAVVIDDDSGGIFFRITPTGDYTVLYSFSNDDGQNPGGRLSPGTDGNFYGVSYGAQNDEVYRITPDGTLTNIFPFSNIYAAGYPNDGLVQDQAGNLYGTTFTEGSSGGIVFKIDRGGGLATLHTFTGNDGRALMSGLTLGRDGNLYGVATAGGVNSVTNTAATLGYGTIFQITPAGVLTTLYNFAGDDGTGPNGPLLQASDGRFYGTTSDTIADGSDGNLFALSVSNQPAFFQGEVALTKGVYYLQFPNTDFFGLYTFLSEPNYLYHFDLGFEYVVDAKDKQNGVFLYDFASGSFFYTSPTFPFPYLYDFSLNAVLYYYPSSFAGRFSSNPRYFYNFATKQIITK